MQRIKAIQPHEANGKSRPMLEAVQKKLGMTPNLLKTMAQAPAALKGYLGLSGALSEGDLTPKLREQIALAVGQANGCDYCLAAHSAAGKMVGLSIDEIQDARRGQSTDSRSQAVLQFARAIVEKRGWASDSDLDRVRKAGLGDGAIAEIVANVALNLYTNYFNHVAQTEVDF